MENNIYKYKAFISYRHTLPDMEVAKKLISLIEGYNIPAKIIEEHHTPKRVGKLFRDDDELKASPDLSRNIIDALDNSEYLIAVCSREYVMSEWCMLEAKYWMKNKDKDKIILILVDGRSSEAIPAVYCEGGRRPFAIDIRGDSVKGIVKNVNNQKLRILSTLIGCDYDDLKLRNKEQSRLQRVKWVVSVIAAVMVTIALIFFYYDVMRIRLNLTGNSDVYGYSYSISSWNKSRSTDSLQVDDRYNATAVSCTEALYDYFRSMTVMERLPLLGISPAVCKELNLNDNFDDTGTTSCYYHALLSESKYASMDETLKYVYDHYVNYTDNNELYVTLAVRHKRIEYCIIGEDEQILRIKDPDQLSGKVGIAVTTEVTEKELGLKETAPTGDLETDIIIGNSGSILFDAEDLSEYILLNNPESIKLTYSHGVEIKQMNSYAQTLKKIDLCGSDLSSFNGAAVFDKVTELDISHTDLIDISGISRAFPNLEILNCGYIEAEDLSTLEKLPLKELNISSYNKKVHIDLSKLKQLESLDVSGCIFESDSAIKDIAGLTSLKTLRINGIRWDDGSYSGDVFSDFSVLSTLTELKELDISNCTRYHDDNEKDIKSETNDFSFLSGFRKLESLTFADININDLDIDFISDINCLSEIMLKTGHIDCSVFTDLYNLENVTLESSDEEVFSINMLKHNKNIKKLSFPINDVSDISELKGFTKLEDLNLPMHTLTSEEVDILCGMESLENVRVQRISAKDAKRLKKATGCYISICAK